MTELNAKLRDAKFYIEHWVHIRTKDQQVVKLRMKPAQLRLYDIIQTERAAGRPVRIVILKARQLGFSTVIEALYFHDTATRPLVETLIIAHSSDATTKLFRMNKLFFDMLPPLLRPMRKNSNAREIVFENPEKDAAKKAKKPGLRSAIRCVTAGSGGAGRGSTLTNIHASEAAFWGDMKETMDGLLSAVPDDPNTAVIVESTPNGFNEFKDFWDDAMAGKNGFLPLFFPWYEEPGYRKPVPSGTVWTEEEMELKEAYGLDEEQLSWRRWCIRNNLGGDAVKFRQEYPSCPEEAFLMSGNPFFDNEKILLQIQRTADPVRRGRFLYEVGDGGKPVQIRWEDDAKGEISIWEEPKAGYPYVLGGDTAGDGSDRFTAHLINNTDGKQAAELLYDGTSELWYAQQIYCMGLHYNSALLGVEINYSTYPERKLEEWRYTKLFIREKTDDASRELQTKKLGWDTNASTRPRIIANLHAVMRDTPEVVRSADTLREMLVFVRNKHMRPEAAPGEHDDLVVAAAICHGIRDQQSVEITAARPQRQKTLREQLEKNNRKRRR